jgi:glycosyltransferase involved in cell wall biosynthesis
MHITALVKSHDHVCCRYRMAAFRSFFEKAGHSFSIRPWSGSWFLQQMFTSFRDGMDALIIQRKLFSAWQLNMIRRRVRWLMYDFDDAIFLHSSYNPRGHDSPRRFEQFKDMLHTADVVIGGNRFLCEQAMGFTQPDKVHLIPTCVDVGRYRLANHEEKPRRVQLVWIGSASTLRGLEKNRATLEMLGKEIPRLELKVICDRSLMLRELPIRFCPWQEKTETAELADADIGICWMPDDAWSEGKCGLKVLQYMAAGLPVVANPVGIHKKMVRHGETGFLVETPQEWVQAVSWLASDPVLRRTMGQAGRALVEAEYQLANGEAGWREVLATVERSVVPLTV